jgi:hypothetical protein
MWPSADTSLTFSGEFDMIIASFLAALVQAETGLRFQEHLYIGASYSRGLRWQGLVHENHFGAPPTQNDTETKVKKNSKQ